MAVGASQCKVDVLAEVTVNMAVPEITPTMEVITIEPADIEVASPFDPAALLIEATLLFDELQVEALVRFCTVLSENVPVAVNCFTVPVIMDELPGDTDIVASVAAVTVSVVEADRLPDVAVIVVEPVANALEKPLEPAALLMDATLVADELHVMEAVKFCVELSEYVPIAVNCWDVPLAMLWLAGVTDRDIRVAGLTVRVVDPETLPDVAVIVAVPVATVLANPFEPAALLIEATPLFDEFHVAEVVRSCVVLSEKVAVAVNCWLVPLAML